MLKIKEVDITNIIMGQVGNFQTYKTEVINKDGKVFLRITIGDLQELKELKCEYCRSALVKIPDKKNKYYCPNEMCLFDEEIEG